MAYGPGRTDYPEPGPAGDPWQPYVRQASNRFGVPQQWIRAVIQQESGGQEYRFGQPIVSGAGAMGLMQLMPATYADMQAQNNLGPDPFEPHDNILAGTAYLRLMYDRYGAPAFLAAYNAGPQRLDDYLSTGRSLPNETVDYVASIAPNLGTEVAMSGPLATYADSGRNDAAVLPTASVRLAAWHGPARPAGGACWHDPDAAFDPDAPCQAAPVQTAPIQAAAYAPARPAGGACWHDPDAAFDPQAPCQAAPVRRAVAAAPMSEPAPVIASAIYMPAPPPTPRAPTYAAPTAYAPAPAYGAWSIQVGAYNSPDQARFATTMARQAAYAELAGSRSLVMQTSRFGGAVLYRARLAGLARPGAGAACAALGGHDIPCMVVPPGG
ncbi:lytic transglycosylase domain-containing protein [Lichenicoccus sp.]|uniref:lytic transglycosylase domain-containing protein n=1 Tax=Lichenicoccus sp. TaxID=2781899 RepID=UPI003D0E20D5